MATTNPKPHTEQGEEMGRPLGHYNRKGRVAEAEMGNALSCSLLNRLTIPQSMLVTSSFCHHTVPAPAE